MKRKLVVFGLWIILSGLFIWIMMDIGRSIGANANSAIANYVEIQLEYNGKTGLEQTGMLADMTIYSMFHNLSEEYKEKFLEISVITIFYVVVTLVFYHTAFMHKEKNAKNETNSD